MQKQVKQTKKKVGRFIIDLNSRLVLRDFSSVYQGYQQETKQKVTIKVYDRLKIQEDPIHKKDIECWLRTMMRLRSQYILRFIDVLQTKTNLYVVLQTTNDGELRDILKKNKRLTQKQTIKKLIQLLNGFGELLTFGIIHRNLSPENIFVSNGILKIGNFGFIQDRLEDMMIHLIGVQCSAYMTPQILSHNKYTYKCDIWSLGIIIYQMITGRLPFEFSSKKIRSYLQTVQKVNITFPQDIQVSQQMKDFIKGCLKFNLQDRFGWVEVFTHPVFKDVFNKQFKCMKKGEQNIGYILSAMITERSIKTKQIFSKYQNKQLNIDQFTQLMTSIALESINTEQIKMLFQILNKNDLVQLKDFQKLLIKYGYKTEQKQTFQSLNNMKHSQN